MLNKLQDWQYYNLINLHKRRPDGAMLGSSGWVMDWNLQEPDGLVAHARNKAVALGRDLLTNGNMEAGDPPDDWTANDATLDGVADERTGGTGSQSMEVTVNGAGQSDFGFQSFPTEIGKEYKLSGWVKNVDATKGAIYTAQGEVTVDDIDNATTSWVYGEQEFAAIANPTIVRLAPIATGAGEKARFDDVQLQQINIAASSSYPGPELLTQTNGVMDKDNWAPVNSATLTNPESGVLRVARNGSNNPGASQTPAINGLRVQELGFARSDGNAIPRLVGSAAFWIGNTSTTYQDNSTEFVPGSDLILLQSLTSTGTEYTEWRDQSLRTANPLNGDHSGVTVGVDGNDGGILRAARYDGGTSYTQLPANMISSMMDFTKGTIHVWARVSGAGVWTDGIFRRVMRLYADNSNALDFVKLNTNNDLSVLYIAGGITKSATLNMTTTDFFMLTLTWDVGAGATGEVKIYLNAVQQGATLTNLGTWVGNLDSTNTVIGAANTTPNNVWDGDIAYIPIANQVQSQAEITAQYLKGV